MRWWAGLDEIKNRGRVRCHPVRGHGYGVRQNRLVLNDLDALHEVADKRLPLRERTFLEELPEVGNVPLYLFTPNPPKDTDGRREDSGRVGEGATGEMAGLHWGRLEVGGRSSVAA